MRARILLVGTDRALVDSLYGLLVAEDCEVDDATEADSGFVRATTLRLAVSTSSY